ncbi:MAG: peptidase M23 [Gammaproteobacteria bacterium]|nr:peptidase M23 [Gammaproteobacteria bacterium]
MRLPFEPRVSAAVLAGAKYSKLRANSSYPDDLWRNVTVRVGDNLSLIFNRVGASRSDLQQVLDTDKNAGVALTKLEPGQVTRFRFEQSKLLEFIYEQDYLTSLRLVLDGPHSNANWIKSKPEIRVASAVAEINHSVFIDGQKAGLLDKTIMEFINVFGWDVDFLRDLQRGDRFSIVFEELYKDGEKIGNGKILAAEFVNNGKQLRALHYQNESGVAGYFSDKGEAMRKAFLRTPVNFTRISSRFSLARKHPILNRIRAHKGVDYSAPMGTPIQAVADGKAEFVGWQGGYGRVVVLKHGATYSTLYGHMSRFARGLRTSSSISQGQTIGFVGKTGLATGPHLHYEFRVDNQHRDPLTVKFPNSLPLDGKFKDDFQRKSSAMLARLDSLRETPSTEDKSLVAKAELIHKPFRQPN